MRYKAPPVQRPIVIISIFRETIIGGVAVHSSNLYERIVEEGMPVEKVNYAPVFVAKGAGRKAVLLAKLGVRLLRLRARGAKIFHFHASNRALVYYLFGWLIALSGGRVLLSLHSGYGYDKWLAENRPYDWINQIQFRFLHQLIFMNPEESERIGRRYPFLRGRIKTINPFIAPPTSAIPVLDSRSAGAGAFSIIAIGVWMRRYNVGEAILAGLRFFEETGVPTTVTLLMSTVIVEEAYSTKLNNLIASARASITVNVLENQNNVLDHLAGADVFVRPSLLDSYGLCVAESLLVGTPAVVTDICRRCNNARLYQPGDMDALNDHLLEVWRDVNHTRVRLLDASEDSFLSYHESYLLFSDH